MQVTGWESPNGGPGLPVGFALQPASSSLVDHVSSAHSNMRTLPKIDGSSQWPKASQAREQARAKVINNYL